MPKIKTEVFDADNVFFTADLHIGHTFATKLRTYSDKEEMHEDLITKWNNLIPENANVFILGDISFANSTTTISILGQLNGHLHLIRGNHDKNLSAGVLNFFTTISDTKEIIIRNLETSRKLRIFMSHYSHQIWNMSHYGAYHLFGHSHGSLEGIGRSMDVGLDTNNVTPYTWNEIDAILSKITVHEIDHHTILNKGK